MRCLSRRRDGDVDAAERTDASVGDAAADVVKPAATAAAAATCDDAVFSSRHSST